MVERLASCRPSPSAPQPMVCRQVPASSSQVRTAAGGSDAGLSGPRSRSEMPPAARQSAAGRGGDQQVMAWRTCLRGFVASAACRDWSPHQCLCYWSGRARGPGGESSPGPGGFPIHSSCCWASLGDRVPGIIGAECGGHRAWRRVGSGAAGRPSKTASRTRQSSAAPWSSTSTGETPSSGELSRPWPWQRPEPLLTGSLDATRQRNAVSLGADVVRMASPDQ